ncbi:hypothetical protein KCU95_g9433, partial [Aureobasidium melanogenum]
MLFETTKATVHATVDNADHRWDVLTACSIKADSTPAMTAVAGLDNQVRALQSWPETFVKNGRLTLNKLNFVQTLVKNCLSSNLVYSYLTARDDGASFLGVTPGWSVLQTRAILSASGKPTLGVTSRSPGGATQHALAS